MKSLDPRVNRLPHPPENIITKAPLDQFGTFEVFVQPREGKPFQHEGIVHAPALEMAYVLAKETFTRRFTCTSLFVADTGNIFVSPLTENNQNVYDLIDVATTTDQTKINFEIFHLTKRGKQHVHAGTVEATSPQGAMNAAKLKFNITTPVLNVWVIPSNVIRFTTEEDKDLWATLPEKKFRDAAAYKAGEKLSTFLERTQNGK